MSHIVPAVGLGVPIFFRRSLAQRLSQARPKAGPLLMTLDRDLPVLDRELPVNVTPRARRPSLPDFI